MSQTFKPVWLNRDVPLWEVKVRTPKGDQVFFVLTSSGTVGASRMAVSAVNGHGNAISSQQVILPLITPHVAELDNVLQVADQFSRRHSLALWLVVMNADMKGVRRALVWTDEGAKVAREVAVRSIPGSRWVKTAGVPYPVIVDLDDADKIVRTG